MIRKQLSILTLGLIMIAWQACESPKKETEVNTEIEKEEFQWETERFADIRILRYQVEGFDQLTLKQKELVFYLTQAGLSGRDIIYDQNHRYNLAIRKTLEQIVQNYSGNKDSENWKALLVYAKRVWFSNGIHHHYSNQKFQPEFDRAFLEDILKTSKITLSNEVLEVMFNPNLDAKKVSKDDGVDLCLSSSVNFYAPDITQKEVESFYQQRLDPKDEQPISHGLNTRVSRNANGQLMEEIYKIGGLYSTAIEQIVYWLDKAISVAENEVQAKALKLLVEYYKTGDLNVWDAYNVAWVEATEGDIDYINGFIEVYNDPLSMKANYESIVQIKDFDASARMAVVSQNVQWFEDQSPIMDNHKKLDVKGVTYKTVVVAGESGDAAPSTPIGVNLPNADWIRAKHGSKSVSLANIEHAYDKASGKGLLEEFAFSKAEQERAEKHGELASKLHTALHEVVGHASGKINKGIGNPKETLKNYASTLEEARADLVALYYIMDPKLIELGLMESLEVGKTEYEGYIRNGLMLQLRRIQPGENLEEDHMRNRQLVAAWVFQAGKSENVIERKTVEGKTYFVVNDFDKLRNLFGQLLREIQRIKSEGDFAAGKALVETYGVKVDSSLHKEVIERSAKLNIPPYAGFINAQIEPIIENNDTINFKVVYPNDFTEQMLFYAKNYSFL